MNINIALREKKVCNAKNYNLTAPTDRIMQGIHSQITHGFCTSFLRHYRKDLVFILRHRHKFVNQDKKEEMLKHVRRYFCTLITKACEGVDENDFMKLVELETTDVDGKMEAKM